MWLSDQDLHFFHEGTHATAGRKLGAHVDGDGAWFSVWAPNAEAVEIIGEWNGWCGEQLTRRSALGMWEGHLSGARAGMRYKLHIAHGGVWFDRADPFAACAETPPGTASVVFQSRHAWKDAEWMASRAQRQGPNTAISIYEVHLGSWRKPASYKESAEELAAHVTALGFTHIELLPIMEHPFSGSWGYQTLGYFAPTSRYGSPDDFRAFVDAMHTAGIGVILDWVPSHFPMDAHGLYRFDGTPLFEHADPREGFHNDWNSAIFDYGRNEVRSFLISSALSWLEDFHADGLRVDAVASMLYRDYSRKPGDWIPNAHGGRENLEAIAFLKQLNATVHTRLPGVLMIAEESTAFTGVTRPEGLGFDYKWDMGWMHDTLRFFSRDPVHRRYHFDDLSFRQLYAGSERHLLALSHDEVVHGKGSLYARVPGNHFDKLASLRLLYAYMLGQTGKKLLFMGQELADPNEWDHEGSIPWHLREDPGHAGVERWLCDLLAVYRRIFPENAPMRWQEDRELSLAVLERGNLLVVMNFTPMVRTHRVNVPAEGIWREVLNSDAEIYGGSGQGNMGEVSASEGMATLTLGPLAAVVLQR